MSLAAASVLRLRPGSHSGRSDRVLVRFNRQHAEAGKKRTFAEELVFALSDGEESDEDGEPEPKHLHRQEPQESMPAAPSERLQAWYQVREDFQPPHIWCQSCPGNAGGGLPSLPVGIPSPADLMNILLAIHNGEPVPGTVRASLCTCIILLFPGSPCAGLALFPTCAFIHVSECGSVSSLAWWWWPAEVCQGCCSGTGAPPSSILLPLCAPYLVSRRIPVCRGCVLVRWRRLLCTLTSGTDHRDQCMRAGGAS